MSWLRRIDDALLDVAQGFIAKLATRTGNGKESVMRDAYLACAIVCGSWAVLAAYILDANAMLFPLAFGALELVDAFRYDRLARRERTLEGWKASVERATKERVHGFWVRLVKVLLTITSAALVVVVLATLILAGDPEAFAGSLLMFALATWFVVGTIAKYLEATQPPSPDASRTTSMPEGSRATSIR